MESASGRLVAATAVLVAAWVVTYWLYEPSKRLTSELATLDGDVPAAARSTKQDLPKADPTPVKPTPLPKQDEPKPTPPSPQPQPPQPPVQKPEFDDYIVQSGDTFEKIAKAKLGSASLAHLIKQANPMKDPHRLKAGETIRIPRDPGNIQGKPNDSTPPAEPMQTYVVQSGDTLSGIASKLLGSSKHWKLILDANSGTLESADKLRVGMTIKIPKKPE